MADDKAEDGRGGDDQKAEDGRGGGGMDGSADLVNDIVNRATALGGWLVVSFVAPLPPSRRRFVRNTSAIERAARRSMTFEATERTKAAIARTAGKHAPSATTGAAPSAPKGHPPK